MPKMLALIHRKRHTPLPALVFTVSMRLAVGCTSSNSHSCKAKFCSNFSNSRHINQSYMCINKLADAKKEEYFYKNVSELEKVLFKHYSLCEDFHEIAKIFHSI